MNIFKSHFWYSKSQRNGVFFLVIVIVALQLVYSFVNFSSDELIMEDQPEIIAFQRQIDSLKAVEIENRKPKIYPFNPNFISDYKGEQLGMSLNEIDRIQAYRKTGKFVNSKREFQRVTKVSDSLLNMISPYFKFPDWVVKRNQQKQKTVVSYSENTTSLKSKEEISTTNVNLATEIDFQFVNGINANLAERIVKYRSKLQGFSFESQLYEVFNIDEKIAKKILKTFRIVEKPNIQKLNVNTVDFRGLLKNPYIDYELCKKIFNYRDEVAELQNISELKNIEDFPLDKYDRIVLYLDAK
jgi:DNA uptake protein ComE-like DNA-binding protein